jgi:hypothetical protein
MRYRSGFLVTLLCGCGPVHKTETRPDPVPVAGAAAPAPTPAVVPCNVKTRGVSVPGRGGVRPDVAAAGNGFAVVWEETERHPGIHFQALDADANPIGPGVEIADLQRGGAEPRIIATGDGYLVIWTVDQPDTSMIAARKVDAKGKPLGDVMPLVSTPNARPLAATAVDDGFALAWWTWSAMPAAQNVTWLDPGLKSRGKAMTLAKGQLVEPWVDLHGKAELVRAAWIEAAADGSDHVFSGELTRAGGLKNKTDLGTGDDPSIAGDQVVFTTLTDGKVFQAPFGVAQPVQIAEGQSPVADERMLCLVSYGSGESSPGDVLRCATLDGGKLGPEREVLTAPGGVLTLKMARAGETTGLVYQTEAEGGGMGVDFAAVRCAKP